MSKNDNVESNPHRGPILLAVTKNEPCDLYVIQDTTVQEVVSQLQMEFEIHVRRGQLFSLRHALNPNVAYLQAINAVKLKGLADLWFFGEREQCLQHYVGMTEEMSAQAAVPELKRAITLLQTELEKCEGEVQAEQNTTGN